MTIYRTQEWNGHGKQNYYWCEYRLEDGEIVKYKCHRQKFFNGDENEWQEEANAIESWATDSPDLPGWLHQYL